MKALQVKGEEAARHECEGAVATARAVPFAARDEGKERQGEDAAIEGYCSGRSPRKLCERRRLRDGDRAEGGTEPRVARGESERCGSTRCGLTRCHVRTIHVRAALGRARSRWRGTPRSPPHDRRDRPRVRRNPPRRQRARCQRDPQASRSLRVRPPGRSLGRSR